MCHQSFCPLFSLAVLSPVPCNDFHLVGWAQIIWVSVRVFVDQVTFVVLLQNLFIANSAFDVLFSQIIVFLTHTCSVDLTIFTFISTWMQSAWHSQAWGSRPTDTFKFCLAPECVGSFINIHHLLRSGTRRLLTNYSRASYHVWQKHQVHSGTVPQTQWPVGNMLMSRPRHTARAGPWTQCPPG